MQNYQQILFCKKSSNELVRPKNFDHKLNTAVWLTLAYASQFNYPLTPFEVWLRLIYFGSSPLVVSDDLCVKSSVKPGVKPSEVGQSLVLLEALGLIVGSANHNHCSHRDHCCYSSRYRNHSIRYCYHLTTSKVSSKVDPKHLVIHLSTARHQREDWSALKWQEVARFKRLARWIPWIEGVAVTGSLAMDNVAGSEDDVDFLVVTSPGSLWLARPLLIFLAWMAGKRRSWYYEEANSWCFNLWLESDNLTLGKHRRRLYSAYEVCQARWMLDRHTIEARFLSANRWVQHFLPNYYSHKLTSIHSSYSVLRHPISLLDEAVFLLKPLTVVVNRILFGLQYLYMRSHMTHEEVGLKAAFFHPRDTQGIIYRRWRNLIKSRLGLVKDRAPKRTASIIPPKLKARLDRVRRIDEIQRTGQARNRETSQATNQSTNQLTSQATNQKTHQSTSKIVLVTGVFDVLHQEHKRLLEKAKALGGFLVVGLESDFRVRQLKGEDRPVFSSQERKANLEKWKIADAIFILPEKFSTPQDHKKLITAIRPNILAVSSHTKHLDRKQKIMDLVGGEVRVVHHHNPFVSSSLVLAD